MITLPKIIYIEPIFAFVGEVAINGLASFQMPLLYNLDFFTTSLHFVFSHEILQVLQTKSRGIYWQVVVHVSKSLSQIF